MPLFSAKTFQYGYVFQAENRIFSQLLFSQLLRERLGQRHLLSGIF